MVRMSLQLRLQPSFTCFVQISQPYSGIKWCLKVCIRSFCRLDIVKSRIRVLHRIRQLRFFFFFITTPYEFVPPSWSAVLWLLRSLATTMSIAMAKISSTPILSLLLHSMYRAPIFSATAIPVSVVTGVNPCVLSRSMHVRFVRKSDLRPTSTSGV